jgi:uncharacterized Zn ribbon protein
MNTHSCLKCKTQYTDDEVDAYYCSSCNEERKRIANEIDMKLAHRPKKQMVSPLQEYDAQQKYMGRFIKVNLN